MQRGVDSSSTPCPSNIDSKECEYLQEGQLTCDETEGSSKLEESKNLLTKHRA